VEPFTLGHRKALDGVRGVAILLVLLHHFAMQWVGGGFVGVDLFFVLSGFLITSLLLEEWRATGTISLGAFYARRALRLLPALVVVLLAMVLVSAGTEAPKEAAAMRTTALMTLLYSANWFLAFRSLPRPELSPMWSLSVEEQFYIVWPVLLVILLRMGWSRRSMGLIVTAMLLASAGLRLVLWERTGSFNRIMFGTDTHADGLLAGALAAMVVHWGGTPRREGTLRALNWAAVLVVGFLIVFAHLGWPADPYMPWGGFVALNVAAVALIVCLISAPWAGVRRLFEFAPLVWLGRISYGVYLWHMAAPWILGRMGVPLGGAAGAAAMGVSVGAAALSFYALERPMLRFKRRFERVGAQRVISP
jgi:peptidoglycan/LPS O-acetylase OafA/YrhL